MEKLVGRQREINELKQAMLSDKSELIVLYGRRRIGKTFLVRSFFKDAFTFHFVGAHKKSAEIQLQNFREALIKYSCQKVGDLLNWHDAFLHLENYLERSPDKKKVLFFDELPWADTQGSDLIDELEYFWASWVQNRDDIILIVCGSATSWMKEKLEDNQGGLHNRTTRRIYLRPFYLSECKEYLLSHNFLWDDYQIMQCYMIFGGIPYYISLLRPDLSLPENVDNLFFKIGGLLSGEFTELYNALFNNAERYIKVVELLSGRREGFTRIEIESGTGYSGGGLTKILNNLESCDFIVSYTQFGNKKKSTLYRLCDFYTLFYFKYIVNNNSRDEAFWQHNFGSRSVESWEGFSFEELCIRHLPHIKHGLGISGIATESSAWRSDGAQVDLVIKRVDKMVHLCEMKFSEQPYDISKAYGIKLMERRNLFMEKTGESRGVVITLIAPKGLKSGINSGIIHSTLSSKELFYPIEN